MAGRGHLPHKGATRGQGRRIILSEVQEADDERALRQLFADHFVAVTGYAMRRTSPSDAADVVAETMLVAWRRRSEVPEPPGTRPWLFGVARRVLANQRRGLQRRLALAERLAHDLEAMGSSREPDLAIGSVRNDELRRALDVLPPDDKELLLLSAWEGLSPAEIAIAFGIPPATARSRLHRARRRLKANLSDQDEREREVVSGHILNDGASVVQPLLRGER